MKIKKRIAKEEIKDKKKQEYQVDHLCCLDACYDRCYISFYKAMWLNQFLYLLPEHYIKYLGYGLIGVNLFFCIFAFT